MMQVLQDRRYVMVSSNQVSGSSQFDSEMFSPTPVETSTGSSYSFIRNEENERSVIESGRYKIKWARSSIHNWYLKKSKVFNKAISNLGMADVIQIDNKFKLVKVLPTDQAHQQHWRKQSNNLWYIMYLVPEIIMPEDRKTFKYNEYGSNTHRASIPGLWGTFFVYYENRQNVT